MSDTIATFKHGDLIYELDDLGLSSPTQDGSYIVYRDGKMIVEFDTTQPADDRSLGELLAEAAAALGEVDL